MKNVFFCRRAECCFPGNAHLRKKKARHKNTFSAERPFIKVFRPGFVCVKVHFSAPGRENF